MLEEYRLCWLTDLPESYFIACFFCCCCLAGMAAVGAKFMMKELPVEFFMDMFMFRVCCLLGVWAPREGKYWARLVGECCTVAAIIARLVSGFRLSNAFL